MIDFPLGFTESFEILRRFRSFNFSCLINVAETLLDLYVKVTVARREMNYLLWLAVNLLLVAHYFI